MTKFKKTKTTMNLTDVNKILADLSKVGTNYKRVSTDESPNFHQEKNQGEEGMRVDIYDLGTENLFLKIVTYNDSYGQYEMIRSIQFVTPTEKLVKVFDVIQ